METSPRQWNPEQKMLQEYDHRNQILYNTCQSEAKYMYNVDFSRSREKFYLYKQANVTYCKVPKAGSTLISRLFLQMSGKDLRKNVHSAGLGKFGVYWPLPRDILKTFKFMVARDPYSRLYSAYVDKYFLIEHLRDMESIAKQMNKDLFTLDGETCGYNVTFQDFLNDTLKVALKTNKPINRHWSPLYLLCHPCDVTYHLIVKQETLSQDLMFVMKQLNISKGVVGDLMTTVSTESICERLHLLFENRFVIERPRCDSIKVFAYRVWEGFKIQGILRNDLIFPFHEFKGIKNNSQIPRLLCRIIETYRTMYPMNKIEKTQQRRQALATAYRNIPTSFIRQIQELYKLDFLAFGYDANRPV